MNGIWDLRVRGGEVRSESGVMRVVGSYETY